MDNITIFLLFIILVIIIKYLIDNRIPRKSKKRVRFLLPSKNKPIENFTTNKEFVSEPNNLFTKRGPDPANYFSVNFNTPNFDSNVEDLRKYYTYEEYDGIKEKKHLPNTSNPVANYDNSLDAQNYHKIKYENENLYKAIIPNFSSDIWNYNNEIPMNGGMFGSVVGFDTLNSPYSFYQLNEKIVPKDIPITDDIRNGMGYPNQMGNIIDNKQN